jgi:hypothetical protein
MNAFTHPIDTVDDSPQEVVVNKRLTELGQSKITSDRLRQFDYFEFEDETRINNIMIFESMLTKLQGQLGQDCKLLLVRGKNNKKEDNGFDTVHYFVGFQTTERAYAVHPKFFKEGLSFLKKLSTFMYIFAAVCVPIAIVSIPGLFLLIGLFTLPLSLGGIFVARKAIKQSNVQQQIFEKILSVSDAIPNAIRYEV